MTQHASVADPAAALWQRVLIHRVFRRGLRRIDLWIGDVPPEGTKRADAISTHLGHVLDAIHEYHQTERASVWPRLHDRAPHAQLDRLETDRQQVDLAAGTVRAAMPAWTASPTLGNATALREALSAFRKALAAHLDHEERDLVPLIAQHLTAEEWAQFGGEAFRRLPPAHRCTALGQLLEAATPDEGARLLAGLPASARANWLLVGRRRYAATMSALRGRGTPAILRPLLVRADELMVNTYRKSEGRRMGSVKGLPVLLLTVRGRRTGRERTVSVAYFDRDGARLVVGSGGGSAREPQWFSNLRAADTVTVQVGADVERASVRIPGRVERDRLWAGIVERAPFFAKYQVKAQRLQPVGVLTPVSGAASP